MKDLGPLDHLDDPREFVPDAMFRSKVLDSGRRLRRRGRGIRGAVTAVVVALAVGVPAIVGFELAGGGVDRVDVSGLVADDGIDPEYLLIVGTDDALDLTDAGVVSSRRGPQADLIVLARLSRGDRTLDLLSLPRDLLVGEKGDGAGGLPLRSVLSERGAPALIAEVEALTGTAVERYVEIGFDGFSEIVDHLGGLRLDVGTRVRDQQSGLDLPGNGCRTVGGAQALALVRSRSLEQLDDRGLYRLDGRGDLGRIDRQQAVLRAFSDRFRTGDLDIETLGDLARTVFDNVRVDDETDLGDLMELLETLADLPDLEVTTSRPQVSDRMIDGANVLDAEDPADFERFVAGTAVPAPGPAPAITPC